VPDDMHITSPISLDVCVVHQDIEAAVLSLNHLRRGCDRVLSCDVDLDKVNISESSLLGLSDGVLPPFGVPRTEQHGTSAPAHARRLVSVGIRKR
jgi:hypothetical protein